MAAPACLDGIEAQRRLLRVPTIVSKDLDRSCWWISTLIAGESCGSGLGIFLVGNWI
jgi:hypothetical protein